MKFDPEWRNASSETKMTELSPIVENSQSNNTMEELKNALSELAIKPLNNTENIASPADLSMALESLQLDNLSNVNDGVQNDQVAENKTDKDDVEEYGVTDKETEIVKSKNIEEDDKQTIVEEEVKPQQEDTKGASSENKEEENEYDDSNEVRGRKIIESDLKNDSSEKATSDYQKEVDCKTEKTIEDKEPKTDFNQKNIGNKEIPTDGGLRLRFPGVIELDLKNVSSENATSNCEKDVNNETNTTTEEKEPKADISHENTETKEIPSEGGLRERSPVISAMNRKTFFQDQPYQIPTTVILAQKALVDNQQIRRSNMRHLSGGQVSANEQNSQYLSPYPPMTYDLRSASITPPLSPLQNFNSLMNSESFALDDLGFQAANYVAPLSPAQSYPGSPQQPFSPETQVVPDNDELGLDYNLSQDIIEEMVEKWDQRPYDDNQKQPARPDPNDPLLQFVIQVGKERQQRMSPQPSPTGTQQTWSPQQSPSHRGLSPQRSSPELSLLHEISQPPPYYSQQWPMQASPEQQNNLSSPGTSPPRWEPQSSPAYQQELSPQPSPHGLTSYSPIPDELSTNLELLLNSFPTTLLSNSEDSASGNNYGPPSPMTFTELQTPHNATQQDTFYSQGILQEEELLNTLQYCMQQQTNAQQQIVRPTVTIPTLQIPTSQTQLSAAPSCTNPQNNLSNVVIVLSPPVNGPTNQVTSPSNGKPLRSIAPKPLNSKSASPAIIPSSVSEIRIERNSKERFKRTLDARVHEQMVMNVWSKPIDEIFQQDNDGDTNLHIAVCNRKRELIYCLVERCLDPQNTKNYIDLSNNKGETALYLAGFTGQSDVVEYLLEAGANPNAQTTDNNTALHVAANQGFDDVVGALTSHRCIDCNLPNIAGQTPLQIAVLSYGCPKAPANRYIQTIHRLLKSNASLSHQERNTLKTPLHMAVEKKSLELVKVLCSATSVREAVNLQNAGGLSAVHMAANLMGMDEQTQCDIIRVLVNSGADITLRTHCGTFPIDLVSLDRMQVNNLLARISQTL